MLYIYTHTSIPYIYIYSVLQIHTALAPIQYIWYTLYDYVSSLKVFSLLLAEPSATFKIPDRQNNLSHY